jgi:hypothetical protein
MDGVAPHTPISKKTSRTGTRAAKSPVRESGGGKAAVNAAAPPSGGCSSSAMSEAPFLFYKKIDLFDIHYIILYVG